MSRHLVASAMCDTQRHQDLELSDLEKNESSSCRTLQKPDTAYFDSIVRRQANLVPPEEDQGEPSNKYTQTCQLTISKSGSVLASQVAEYLQSKFQGFKITATELATINRTLSSPFGVSHHLRREVKPLREKAGQSCFICFQMRDRDSFAVQVPCLRPTKPRRAKFRMTDKNGVEHVKYLWKRLTTTERRVECDSDICHRIEQTAFAQYGDWTRYLPFYGVTDVQEVEFKFRGSVDAKGTFPIILYPLDVERINKQLDWDIGTAEVDDDRCDDSYHSELCRDLEGQPCIQEKAKWAEKRKLLLKAPYLLRRCIQHPETADREKHVVGIAIESCIVDTKGPQRIVVPRRGFVYDRAETFRELQVTIGWQSNEILAFLPVGIGWLFVALSGVWLCTAWWIGGIRDIKTGVAFGQLVAASIPILVANTRK